MAIYPISQLIFRTHELTNTRFRLCPACLRENNSDNADCTYCGEAIPNYNEETFVIERLKRISATEEIGIGSSSEKLKRLKDRFDRQYELWDEIVLIAKFVSAYTVSRLDPLDYAREFLYQFPLTEKTIEDLQLNKIDLVLTKRNSSEIKKKLIEIEHRDIFNYFSDFASWSWVFLDETESPFIYKNLSWINIHHGFYKDHNGHDIRIDENNHAHIAKAIEYIHTFDPSKLNVEVLLFPLHWKFLAEEKTKARGKPRFSKPRYLAALQRWIPKTRSHQAWKELGVYYCQDSQEKLPEIISTYRDQQMSADFNERDFNFLFSAALITGSVSEDLLHFPYQRDSYFAPLVSLYQDTSYIKDYFLNFSNRESWIRALHFYDFSNASFVNDLGIKILTEMTDEEFADNLGNLHPSLLPHLLLPSLENGSKKKISLVLNLSIDWSKELQKINIADVYSKNAEVAQALLEKTQSRYTWPSADILKILKQRPLAESVADRCYQILRKDTGSKADILIELFNLWIENRVQNNVTVASKLFDSLPVFMESKNPFSTDFKPALFRKNLLRLWLSTKTDEVKIAEEFINAHVDLRGIRLDSLSNEYNDSEIFRLFRPILKHSEFRVPRSIAYSFIFELMNHDRLTEAELKALWEDLPLLEHEHRIQLEYRVKEKLPPPPVKTDDPAKKDTETAAAKAELAELKQKMAQMEQQHKIEEERNRIVQEVKDKSARYQIKVTEIQSQYQIEVTKIMASTLSPEEKGKKISDLSAQLNKDMIAVSEILK